jgi:AraC-like DNA-binding protein
LLFLMHTCTLKEIFEPIRSLYHFDTPCDELLPHIEFFSESVPDHYQVWTRGNRFCIEMYPSWTPTMYLNLGPSYRISVGTKMHMVRAGEDVLVLRDGYVCRHNQPNDHIFTVKFFPGGLEAVLGLSQLPLAGKVIPLCDILPVGLLMQVKSAADFQERKMIFERFFLESKSRRNGDHYLIFVMDTIAGYANGALQFNVDQVAGRRFVSSKTLNRYFNRVVGLPPKKYLSLVRARTALTAFLADRRHFDPVIFGYHDQSHFYRDIMGFTGQRVKDS